MAKPLANLRYSLTQRAGAHDRLVPLVVRRASRVPWWAVRAETLVCIEGFPRSGNSFATWVFVNANPGRYLIAHHTHLAGQVARAVRFGVPCALLVREPVATLASLMVWREWFSPRVVIATWIRYHERVAEFADAIAICPFEELIETPGSLALRLNRRYGTRFLPPASDDAASAAAFEGIERNTPAPTVEKLSVPRPERAEANRLARERLRREASLERANDLHRDLLAAAGPRPTRSD
jgi:hypothetical protein